MSREYENWAAILRGKGYTVIEPTAVTRAKLTFEQYDLAIRAFDRMRIGGPSMDGRSSFGGSLTSAEYGAIQAVFAVAYAATQPTDAEVIDQLVDFVRTPEWSPSMLEDIAVIVRQARPDIGDEFDEDDPRAWRRH